jgi:16S rRNA (cytidine1402-2'-O)-methyltransferase
MSKLYIVATPIGNIDDITYRAVEILKKVNVILCEDTRVTMKLLKLLNIDVKDKKLLPYFEHNEKSKIKDVLTLLTLGYEIALVTDAGMPVVSDPGFPLINHIQNLSSKEKENIQIEVIPGASSTLTALVYSGMASDKFTFLGYIPRKSNDRKKFFKQARDAYNHVRSTYICFENLNRLEDSLSSMHQTLGDKVEICLCRELTKIHEEIIKTDLPDLINKIKNKEITLKGEAVIVFTFKY